MKQRKTISQIREAQASYGKKLAKLSFEEKIRILVEMQRNFSIINKKIIIWDIPPKRSDRR